MVWSAENVSRVIGGELLGDASTGVRGCVLDSRRAREGNLFFALPGERADGHDYIDLAWERGAAVAVGERSKVSRWLEPHAIPAGKALIVVDSAFQALQECARAWIEDLGARVVGITGSNGKTTTKDMITAVLSRKFRVHANRENQNNELGLPLTVLNAPPDTEILVLEMGMRGLGQIKDLCAVARPEVGVITNIGTTHMELLGSQENIARAKWELIEALPPQGYGVLNGEDEWSVKLSRTWGEPGRPVLHFYGIQGKYVAPEVRGKDIQPSGELGTVFTVEWNGEECQATLPVPGEHNVLDALAALTVGIIFQVPLTEGCRGLAGFELSPLRLELYSGDNQSRLLSDVYNANPVSMQASLGVLRERAGEHETLAILGEMYELGEQGAEGHRQVGHKVQDLGIGELIVVGPLAREIGRGALEQGYPDDRVHFCRDRREAIETARTILRRFSPGAWVLIKGSRGMKMEEVTHELRTDKQEREGIVQ